MSLFGGLFDDLEPWQIALMAGGTALTGGMLAPALAGGAAAAGAAGASGLAGGAAGAMGAAAGAAPEIAASTAGLLGGLEGASAMTPMFTEAAALGAEGMPMGMNIAMGGTDWTAAAPKGMGMAKGLQMAGKGAQMMQGEDEQRLQAPVMDDPPRQVMSQEAIRRKWLAINDPRLYRRMYGNG